MSTDNIQPVHITIKKGQGVTQALKELVTKNNAKLSDGSISKDEWTATVKALDEIQAQRKQDGKTSIFGDNYIVYTGDEINFTEEETEKLYKAMGVEISQGATTENSKKVVTKNGREAFKNNDGTYEYRAADGTELNPKYARLKDPELGKLKDNRFDKDQNMIPGDYKNQDKLAKQEGSKTTPHEGIYMDSNGHFFKYVQKLLKDGRTVNEKVMLPDVTKISTHCWWDKDGQHTGRP